MSARIAVELELLREVFPAVVYEPNGDWFLIPEYPLPSNPAWTPAPISVAFHAPAQHPGQVPYGIWVPSGVKVGGHPPENMKDPAKKQPPFAGQWAVLSWTVDQNEWKPSAEVTAGSNLVNYALSFVDRFAEGR